MTERKLIFLTIAGGLLAGAVMCGGLFLLTLMVML
jgi:hypothetical protein